MGTHGKISLVPDNIEKGIINPRLLKITLDKSKSLPEFMKILLGSKLTERQVLKFSHGLTMGILNTEIIRQIRFALPPIQEQQKIAAILSKVDNTVHKHHDYRSKLEYLKEGLMQKLLTGKLRVKV